MAMTVEGLLGGPRGRGVCMAVAHRLSDRVWSDWLQASWNRHDDSRRRTLVRTLEMVPVGAPALRDDVDGLFVAAVRESVGHAMYWQPPHDEDVIAADPAVIDALRPLAETIVASAAVRWWSEVVDLNDLQYTIWRGDAAPATDCATLLARWRRLTVSDEVRARTERPADPHAMYSGNWWSTPGPTPLVTTTRALRGLGSLELVWREDDPSEERARVQSIQVTGSPRVYEVDGPDSWVRLVERFPLHVTHSRRHDWFRTTGRNSSWFIPDWSAVAQDWDAVHLSVAGYLWTATRALTLSDGVAATMLAGWNPDQTWWLRDVLERTAVPVSWELARDPGGDACDWTLVDS